MPARFFLILVSLSSAFLSCKPNSRANELGFFKMGERAQAGSIIYNVIDSQWMISLGKEPYVRVPKNRFLLLNLSATNGGGKDDISVPSFNLIDDSGETYPELASGDGVPDWLGFSRRIQPAETITGNVAFDVPPKHVRLKVMDEQNERYAWVDVPLSFGEAQQSPVPK